MSAEAPANPVPLPLPPPRAADAVGLHLQRTMTLLATSTAERPNRVRILFYGQSITRQDWWQDVVADLRARFPHADLVAENRAIGGFSSQRLIDTVDRDAVDFYPDLVVFHVYGNHHLYEEIIRRLRTRTAAEVAIQTDHFAAGQDPSKPDDGWTKFMNGEVLPSVAARYGGGLLPVREAWRAYLTQHGLQPRDLLCDGVHLNDRGCRLMGALVARELVHRPDLPDDEWRGLARTVEIGTDAAWENGRLRLDFDGNRVLAVAGPGGGRARVLVDGRSPSSFCECYTVTRANEGPGVDWPWDVCAPVRIDALAPWTNETWTLTILEGDAKQFRFRLTGSVTGPDGEGTSDQRFVSTSGRIVIGVGLWWTTTAKGKPNPIAPGYELRFETRLLGADELAPVPAGGDAEVLLIQGLPSGRHTLELVADGGPPPDLRALRVYRPPLP